MSYNLILNSEFKTNYNWKFINCKYENSKLISNSKIFGIEQELILPDPTKLYFRVTYKTLTPYIKDVKIGIQNDDILNIDVKVPKFNKEQKISVIDIAKQEKIKLHIIFESFEDINEVEIKEPILVDLNYMKRSTWLKFILDRTIHYLPGYSYINEHKSEILPTDEEFKGCTITKAKIGSIININDTKIIDISAKFIDKGYYLAKLDFEEINQFGEIYFKYGVIRSTNIKDQCYLIFKANEKNTLQLVMNSKEPLPYKINLKHILLIKIDKLGLLKSDIPYLPFIGD